MVRECFDATLAALVPACCTIYGDRLESLAVFGSVARGLMRPDSDIDLIIVAEPLPNGRFARVEEFEQVEAALSAVMNEAKRGGVNTWLAPVFKTPAELEHGSLLFLDLPDQARILYDEHGLLRAYLDRLAARLRAMGARRVAKGAATTGCSSRTSSPEIGSSYEGGRIGARLLQARKDASSRARLAP